MRVMVFVKATEASENGMAPTPEMLEAFAAMDRFTEELVEAGVFVAAAGLKPSAQSKRIAIEGASRTVIDGPFAEARELVAGFSIWEVKDMDEAVAWAKRCPNTMPGAQRDRDPALLRGRGSRRFRHARGAGGTPQRRPRQARRRLTITTDRETNAPASPRRHFFVARVDPPGVRSSSRYRRRMRRPTKETGQCV